MPSGTRCHRAPVKLSPFVLAGFALALASCQTSYTKFRVTNYRSDLVADWIAEGRYRKVGTGYEIKAVERTSGPPYMQMTRYPNGWRTTVDGPHIVFWRCGKPLWLHELERH